MKPLFPEGFFELRFPPRGLVWQLIASVVGAHRKGF